MLSVLLTDPTCKDALNLSEVSPPPYGFGEVFHLAGIRHWMIIFTTMMHVDKRREKSSVRAPRKNAASLTEQEPELSNWHLATDIGTTVVLLEGNFPLLF